MLTREEELKNLREMLSNIVYIKSLIKKKDKLAKDIEKCNSRKIDDYPKYVPTDHLGKTLAEIEKNEDGNSVLIHIISLLPVIIYGIVCFFMRATSGNEGIFDMIIFIAIFFGPLILALVPMYGHYLAAGAHVLLGLFLSLGGSDDAITYRNLFLLSAVILVASNIFYWVTCLIVKIASKKKARRMLHQAEAAVEKEKQDYLAAKKIADVEIARKREELEQEKSEEISKLRKNIMEINAEIIEKTKILKNIPGLANEDKNEYTLKTLISYFERHRVDSIKEAINLFIAEEHRKKKEDELDKKIRGEFLSLQFQQDLAISDMKNAQALHNLNVQHRIDGINRKIEDAIEDMKRDNDY